MITTLNHGITKADTLHPQDIGRPTRVAETRQINRCVVNLDSDQRTTRRQTHRLHRIEWVERHLCGSIGGVGPAIGNVVIRSDGKDEARPESMGGPDQITDIHRLADAFYSNTKISSHEPDSTARDESCKDKE